MTAVLGAQGTSRDGDTTTARRPATRWQFVYTATLLAIDAVAVLVAAALAMRVRFGHEADVVPGVSYTWISVGLAVLWLAAMALAHAYDPRYFGVGSEEYRRVGNAAVRVTAVVSFLSFVDKFPVSRAYVGVALPLGLALTLAGRWTARKALQRSRAAGRHCHRVLLVGGAPEVGELVTTLRRESAAGFVVVAACLSDERDRRASIEVAGEPVPVVGQLADVTLEARRLGVDTVAVTASPGLCGDALRRLGWQLEGTGIDLVVAPALTAVAGPRVHVRPVAGLPLLHVEAPRLEGGRRLVKMGLDRIIALLGLLLLLPALLTVAAAVRLTSTGPALFRQDRLGKAGRTFAIYKFRTMRAGADQEFSRLIDRRCDGGLFFKVPRDPRVTPVGRWLRRFSLDEVPQLLNVLKGEMSLVGPRPLPVEVMQAESPVARRLLVKPGMTGLWQISGRSNLPPHEALRYDLYYVENWSIAFDAMIIWKTFAAVLRSQGAY